MQVSSIPHTGYIPVQNTEIFYREIGQGQSIFILHGGPDFDHTYLLPEMDQLSDSYRLIYYDQRGRGKSALNVNPEVVSLQSEVEDLDALRVHFGLETIAFLGHSWGGLLAMEYAICHPERVSHLILMNTAPVSREHYQLLREDRLENSPVDIEKLKAGTADPEYQAGDPDTVAAYYRVHFRAALRQPDHLDLIIERLRASFTHVGILKARAIEKRLMDETWSSSEYKLIPQLSQLNMPTLIMHGDSDFIPIKCVNPILHAIPGAHFVLLKDCGHFSYLECPEQVHKAIDGFFSGNL
jgi:proline iminopeptidase